MTRIKKVFIFLITAMAILYVLAVAFVYFFQEKLLFFPRHEEFAACDCPHLMPVKTSQNGKALRYLTHTTENPKAFLLILHGNAGTACDRCYYIENLKQLPVQFIIPEFPGFSLDQRKPTEKNWLETTRLAYQHLKDLDPDMPIIVFGESLGTGPATWIAAEKNIQGLILQSPYTSVLDIGKLRYPYLPVELILKHTFMSSLWANNVHIPVMIIHGKKDSVIPFENGETQAKNFPAQVQFESFDESGHIDFRKSSPARYWNIIEHFINTTIAR